MAQAQTIPVLGGREVLLEPTPVAHFHQGVLHPEIGISRLSETRAAHSVVEVISIGVLEALLTISVTVRQVACTVTGPFWQIEASACEHRAWPIAYATSIKVPITWVPAIIVADAITVSICLAGSVACAYDVWCPHAIVYIVTNAIAVCVQRTVAIAVAQRDARTTAVIDRSWTIADAADVVLTDTLIIAVIITNAISIEIRETGATTDIERILLVAFTIAIFLRTVGTTAFEDGPGPSAYSALVSVQTEGSIIDRGPRIVIASIRVCASDLETRTTR